MLFWCWCKSAPLVSVHAEFLSGGGGGGGLVSEELLLLLLVVEVDEGEGGRR